MALDVLKYQLIVGIIAGWRWCCVSFGVSFGMVIAMLDKLLEVIKEGGVRDITSLAEQLESTPELVKAMLAHLERMGYLQAVESCGEGCAGCSWKSACGKVGTAPLWRYKSQS